MLVGRGLREETFMHAAVRSRRVEAHFEVTVSSASEPLLSNTAEKAYNNIQITEETIRLRTDTLNNIHRQFISEHSRLSFSLICRPRQFWVVHPTNRDMDSVGKVI